MLSTWRRLLPMFIINDIFWAHIKRKANDIAFQFDLLERD